MINYNNMMKKHRHRCNDCYFRLIVNRVRINKVVTTWHLKKTNDNCERNWSKLMKKRARAIRVTDNQNNTYPMGDAYLNVGRSYINRIGTFLRNWANLESSLYDRTVRTVIRLGESRVAARSAQKAYVYYAQMGLWLMKYYGHNAKAYRIGKNMANGASRKMWN